MSLSAHLLDGGAAPRPTPVPLKAGPHTALFEPDSGVLRHVRLGDHEVVRAICGAVRDAHWNTLPTRITACDIQPGPDHFHITFKAQCEAEGMGFEWTGTLSGDAQGQVVYRFQGQPTTPFQRNRIGLCVLHPIEECAGKPCEVEHVDGTVAASRFPEWIAPVPPFRNVRALRHEPAPGVRVELRFEGDTFETEDQRNWSDASFKTYSTPSNLPVPVEVTPAEHVDQKVTLSFPGPVRKILPILLGRSPQFSIATTPVLLRPPLGLCLPAEGEPLEGRTGERLRALQLAHLRAEVHLDQPDWRDRLMRDDATAMELGTGLHLALHLGERAEEELVGLASASSTLQSRVLLWLVHHRDRLATPSALVQLAQSALSGCAPNALFAAGSRAHFYELNSERSAAHGTALPCFGLTPQVHAQDNRTLVENIAAQPDIVKCARSFAPRAVVVSPITLRPQADPRQMSLFGAGWTLGSLAHLAAGGNLHSLTYYQTTGPGGIMAGAGAATDSWPAPPGSVYPVYHVLADMAGYARLCPTLSSHPLQTEAMTLLDATQRRRILVANLTTDTLDLRIKSGTCKAVIRVLNASNVEEAALDPETFRARPGKEATAAGGKLALELGPYALARVDVVG